MKDLMILENTESKESKNKINLIIYKLKDKNLKSSLKISRKNKTSSKKSSKKLNSILNNFNSSTNCPKNNLNVESNIQPFLKNKKLPNSMI